MQLVYQTFGFIWLFHLVAVWAGEAALFPVEVNKQLEKQSAALKTLYIEVDLTTVKNGREVTYLQTAYFEGDRFRIVAPSDVSFDGEMLWLVGTRPPGQHPSAIIRKTKIRNTTEKTPSFNELYWRFPYFEAAGIFGPHYPRDIAAFKSLEPALIRFAENNETLEIKPEGAQFRVRGSVDDWVLLNFREIDLVTYQKQLERGNFEPERVSREIASLRKACARIPKRTVSMLLDAKHGYLPLEREDSTAEGQLIARYSVEEWKYFQDVEAWLPAKCTASYFTNPYDLNTFSQEPVQRIRMNLKKAEFTARKTEFVLINAPEYRVAGNEVHDETIKNAPDGVRTPVILTLAADGRVLQHSIAVVETSIATHRLWIWIVLSVFAVPPILFLIWRFRFKKQ